LPTLAEKMKALVQFVQADVRYVAIELGIGGYQPNPATVVLERHYGDCKDKATLLSAMLKEVGIESRYLIINSRRGIVTASTPATNDFNHVILAIQMPDTPQEWALPAVVVHPRLGKVLFFDPTNPFVPLGALSGNLQESYGLLVGTDDGELVQLPLLPADSNGTQRMAKMMLDSDGTLSGEVHELWSGDLAATQRHLLNAASYDTDRIKPVERLVSQSIASVEILKANVGNLGHIDQPLAWNYSLRAPNYAKPAGDLLLVRPRVLGTRTSSFLETKDPRQQPIEFDGPERDTDVFDLALPAGYEVEDLPPAVSVDYPFGSYHSKTEMVGADLRYMRSFEIRQPNVPASDADELREFFRAIDNDERISVVLRRSQARTAH